MRVRTELARADSAFKVRGGVVSTGAAAPSVARVGGASSFAAPAAVVLTWTMPTLKADGTPLSLNLLEWQAAYSTQSATYRNHEYWIRNFPDSMAKYWPAVVAEAAPLPVWSGTARPGERVEWAALPVVASAWPYSWWIRTRQRPNGNWSLWSNPVTRADNQ